MNASRCSLLGLLLLSFLAVPNSALAAKEPVAPEICDATDAFFKLDEFSSCRWHREKVQGLFTYYLLTSPVGEVLPVRDTLHCTEDPPHRPCQRGEPGCAEEPFDYDRIAWAEQQCMIKNNERKLDLWRCVDDGIYFAKKPASEACEKNAFYIHERSGAGSSPCDLLNPEEDLVDIGRSAFYSCEAVGPGPAEWGDVPDGSVPDGCCELGTYQLRGDPWQFKYLQEMKATANLEWTEHYFEEWAETRQVNCNHPDTEPDQTVVHHACLLTPKDIMIEGFKNPGPNPAHMGHGWCNVTTTRDIGNDNPDENQALRQFINDLTSAMSYITDPKGVVVASDPNGDLSDPKYTCFRVRQKFDRHCASRLTETKNAQTPWKDHLGFAHSMGAIATSVYALPLQQFGGSVVGPGTNHKNNCDPVPWVVQIGHRVALSLRAPMNTQDDAGSETTVYQICSDLRDAGVVVQNCVDVENWDYVGVPMGPGNCYEAGQDCTWAAWCGTNPYDPTPPVRYTGRRRLWQPDCPTSLTDDLTERISACFEDKGDWTDTYSCVRGAFAAFSTWFDADHAFDGEGRGDGYRPLTGANWDQPRSEEFGHFPICPEGWVYGRSVKRSLCCTVGVPDGAACADDDECCHGLSCNAGRCESEPPPPVCDESGDPFPNTRPCTL